MGFNPVDLAFGHMDALQSANERLKAENAKLREENERFIIKLNAEHIARQNVESDNAKLLELADAVKEFVDDTHCEDCPCRHDCDDNNRIFCVDDFSYRAFAAMRKLGIEVD